MLIQRTGPDRAEQAPAHARTMLDPSRRDASPACRCAGVAARVAVVPLHRAQVDSTALGRPARLSVVLPDAPPPPSGYPTLYLVHGLDDDGTAWLRNTSIVADATARGLALVLPPIGASYGTDEVHGERYWEFLSEELVAWVAGRFPLSARREDTAVLGVSMGGYAALKWALRKPATFAAAATLSGSLDIADPGRYARRPEIMDKIFGGRTVPGTRDDLFWLLAQLRFVPGPLPELFVACGASDAHLDENRRFLAAAAQVRGLAVTESIGPGDHDWGYWQGVLGEVLPWLETVGSRRAGRGVAGARRRLRR